MDNIIVEINNDTVYCYKKDNSYTNNIISQHTGIILDLCNIVSKYANCIIILVKWNNKQTEIIINDYIDFEKILYFGTVNVFDDGRNTFQNLSLNKNNTVLHDTHIVRHINFSVLNKYVFVKYNINDYILYNKEWNDGRFEVIDIIDNEIMCAGTEPLFNYIVIQTLTIHNHTLFAYVIAIYKHILDNMKQL